MSSTGVAIVARPGNTAVAIYHLSLIMQLHHYHDATSTKLTTVAVVGRERTSSSIKHIVSLSRWPHQRRQRL